MVKNNVKMRERVLTSVMHLRDVRFSSFKKQIPEHTCFEHQAFWVDPLGCLQNVRIIKILFFDLHKAAQTKKIKGLHLQKPSPTEGAQKEIRSRCCTRQEAQASRGPCIHSRDREAPVQRDDKDESRATDPRSVLVCSLTLFQDMLSSTRFRLRPTARIPTVVCKSSCPIEICGVSTCCQRRVDFPGRRSPFATDSAVF